MKPKTVEFLNTLLWTAECLSRPTFRNLTESYESWAYRKGLHRQSSALEQQGLVESADQSNGDRLCRLTEKGRLHALGGRNPQTRWSRPWDGKWRMVLYDVPREDNGLRNRLRRHLRARHFGCLQGSVWVTPDPMDEELVSMEAGEINVNSLLMLEARPCAGESDSEVVHGAWDFASINAAYRKYIGSLALYDDKPLSNAADAKRLQRWMSNERSSWWKAVLIDPMLPEELLPIDYLGKEAWQKRIEVMNRAANHIRKFKT